MKNILFVGNGLNLLNSKISWKELLKNIQDECCEKYGLLKGEILFPDGVPNTLQYESIYLSLNEKKRKNDHWDVDLQLELKKMIAEKMGHLEGNAIYDDLIKLPFDHYLTTNYDLLLDKTLQNNGWKKGEGNFTEKIYNIRRYRICTKESEFKRIYPIHGDIMNPRSIMIDYNHYCGTIAKINDYLKGNYKWDKNTDKRLKSIDQRFLDNGNENSEIYSWIDYFFISNIYIVGFGFDWSEIELWWLLNRRRRFLQERKLNPMIYYYCLMSGEEQKDTKNSSICNMLKLLGVTCRLIDVENSNYLKAYKSVIECLNKDLYNNVS